MGQDILIRMEIPIPSQPIAFVPAMIFNYWLPIDESDFIFIDETDSDLKVKLWFDITCTDWAGDLSNWINVTAFRIFVDITVKNLDDEFIIFILKATNEERQSNSHLTQLHRELGKKVFERTIYYVNRLISYVRNEKGQYWLKEYIFDPDTISSRSVEFKAKVKSTKDDDQWVRWRLSNLHTITAFLDDNESTYVKHQEWQQIVSFVKSSRKPTLVLELLANAENLAKNGNRRNAIIEVVVALELAINNFARSPNFDAILGLDLTRRIDVSSFATQVEHVGFSGTIRYLLPLLFKESVLPTDLIKKCQDAIELRGNVIHNGQRDIQETKLLPLLQAIRQLCDVLSQYSK